MNYSPPGSSVHGILQARMVEWVAMFSSRESSRFIDWNCISYLALAGGFFTTSTTWERTNSSFLCFFVAFRPSVDCMMPPGENNLLLTLVIQRLISSRNTFTDTSRMFDQISGYCGLGKLRHKINHYNVILLSCNLHFLNDLWSWVHWPFGYYLLHFNLLSISIWGSHSHSLKGVPYIFHIFAIC